ncbi:MAG: hypothetical protein ABIJ39_08530 [Chloroflexota bacterium]
MKANLRSRLVAVLFLVGTMTLSCGLFPTPVATLAPTAVVPTLPAPAETATVPASPTAVPSPLPPQASPTTPVLGPGIARLPAGQQVEITTIQMVTTTVGWAIGAVDRAGDHVLRTQDGGLTWRDVTPPEPAPTGPDDIKEAIGYFDRHDPDLAWVMFLIQGGWEVPDYAIVWHTQDGGASWQPGYIDTAVAYEGFVPTDLVFANAINGWFLAHLGGGMHHDYVTLYSTQDGGSTWMQVITPYDDPSGIQSCSKTGMAFADARNGWLTINCHGVRWNPFILTTTDGGRTWQEIAPALPPTAPSEADGYCGTDAPVLWSPRQGAFILECFTLDGSTLGSSYYLFTTADGGESWQMRSAPSGSLLWTSSGPTEGFALGRTIFRTVNGGQTWTEVKQVNWDGQFSFVSPLHGWAVARSEDLIALVRTVNGGGIWQEIQAVIAP